MNETVRMVACDACPEPAAWFVYAAYSYDPDTPHPRMARYPAPQARACPDHLSEVLAADAGTPNSTHWWAVAPAPRYPVAAF